MRRRVWLIKRIILLVFIFSFGTGSLSILYGQLYFNTKYKQFNMVFLKSDFNDINLVLNNPQSTFSKLIKGSGSSLGFNAVCGTVLYFAPTGFTHWADNLNVAKGWDKAFTSPPVWDNDPWYINYVGHTYQGAFYYNAVRSQGVSMAGSALFNAAQSLMWEFIWEGVYEQPSKNDLLVTPILGSLIGELIHQMTLRFKRNGFTTIEKIIVIVLNPNYAVLKGF